MKKYILGVGIDDINIEQAVRKVEGWLKKGGKHYIVTPNPEFLVTAQSDPEFKKILNSADLAIPDGKGLKLTGDIECNTPGIDLIEELIKLASVRGSTTGFLGGRGQVAERTAECLKEKYPALKVKFISEEPNDIPKLDILFVAFGHPKQEKWIAKNLANLNVKVAMCVGGSFDIISGKLPRAPLWIRNLGTEWLFRLLIQPWRIKRQMTLIKYLLMLR